MIFPDSHIHITQIANWEALEEGKKKSPVCACAHSPSEWQELFAFSKVAKDSIITSFGIHPQNPNIHFIEMLENMLKEKRMCDCIGEAGFDLFTAEYASTLKQQEDVWNAQLEFCKTYHLPLVVHCRHALNKIFADAKKLSKLPAVIFHSFPGSPLEAVSLIKRNINAYFSFGKPIINGNKRAIACISDLPIDVLLAETDAPYQTLKGEAFTPASDIIKVYKKIAELRVTEISEICNSFENNFWKAFRP